MQIDRNLIQKAKEKLGSENERLIVEALGLENYDFQRHKVCCPFHNENTPSFAYYPDAYLFKCFGCGCTCDLIDALMYSGKTFIDAVRFLFEKADIPYVFGEQGIRTRRHYRYPHEEPNGDKSQVYAYLAKRKLSRETVDYLDIRQDAKGNCVFNYYDTNDVLTMVKYRPSRRVHKENGDIKNWCQQDADTSPLLFNMNRINTASSLLITCGELDCAAAIESGWKNTVSIPLGDQNTKWCDECKDWLDQFDDIILCADNDASGEKFLKTVTPMLHRKADKKNKREARSCRIVSLPLSVEVDGRTREIKDLNAYLLWCGKEKVLDAIVNAAYTPISSVVDLSDVKPIDYETVDGINFGIAPLDDQIVRLFFSTLTIISGRPGAGKSSILDQLMCNAMDQGYNTWLFSGELPNGMNKSWMNYILAGRRHIEEKDSQRGNPYNKVSTPAVAEIDNHYRGKWLIYKDDLDNDLDALILSMEEVVCRKAVKLLILDNFMCIDNTTTDEELRSQTDTIKRLIKFAKEYNVAVVLVCHPRKFDAGAQMDLYDIAGSSNIVNLAHRTIALRRVTEEERENTARMSERKKALMKYDVVISVVKDRLFGRQNPGIGVYYDSVSRRFYTSNEEYDHHYTWDTAKYTDTLISEKIAAEQADEEEAFGPSERSA